MARRRVFRSQARQGYRPPKIWNFIQANTVAILAGNKIAVTVFVPSAAGDETVLRTFISYSVANDGTGFPVVAGVMKFAVGVMVANDTAVALGATGLPGPLTDADSDVWLLNRIHQVTRAGAGSTDDLGWTFDSKAMRRVNQGSSMVMMFENAAASVEDYRFLVNHRVLSKLSDQA